MAYVQPKMKIHTTWSQLQTQTAQKGGQACDIQAQTLQPHTPEPIPHCNTQRFILALNYCTQGAQGREHIRTPPVLHAHPILALHSFLFVSITPEAGQIWRSNYWDFAQKQTDRSEEGEVHSPLEIKIKQSEDPAARDTQTLAQANPQVGEGSLWKISKWNRSFPIAEELAGQEQDLRKTAQEKRREWCGN